MHTKDPAEEYVLATQAVHDVDCTTGEYFPALHETQEEDDAAAAVKENLPAAHTIQAPPASE